MSLGPTTAPAATYQAVRAVLLRYVSRIIVDSMLTCASDRAAVPLPPKNLLQIERLIQELSPGIRTFCAADSLTQLMLDLVEVLE